MHVYIVFMKNFMECFKKNKLDAIKTQCYKYILDSKDRKKNSTL